MSVNCVNEKALLMSKVTLAQITYSNQGMQNIISEITTCPTVATIPRSSPKSNNKNKIYSLVTLDLLESNISQGHQIIPALLECGGIGDTHHGCSADRSIVIA